MEMNVCLSRYTMDMCVCVCMYNVRYLYPLALCLVLNVLSLLVSLRVGYMIIFLT